MRRVDYMNLTHRSAAAILTAVWLLSLAICVPMLLDVDMQLCWRNNSAWLEVSYTIPMSCMGLETFYYCSCSICTASARCKFLCIYKEGCAKLSHYQEGGKRRDSRTLLGMNLNC